MPTDCPRMKSASKVWAVCMAASRSEPVPEISRRLRSASTRIDPGLVANPSSSFIIVEAVT